MTTKSENDCRKWELAGSAALTAGLLGLVYWYRRPIPTLTGGEGSAMGPSLLERYVPEGEFAGEVSVNIHAPAHIIIDALQKVTLDDMPLAKWLGSLRYLPAALAGRDQHMEEKKSQPFLQVIQSEGGNIVLDEKPESEIVIGAIGKFHNLLDQQIVPLASAQDFIHFDNPAYQKLGMSFRLTPLHDGSGYRLTLTHRTHALSQAARWKFALYWIGIKPGGNFVSWLLLRAVRSIAEKATTTVAL
jgi:hypothetical protein